MQCLTHPLYSPLNFYAGLRLMLRTRVQLTLPEALAEARAESPGWGYRMLALALALALGVMVLAKVLPAVAPAAMQGLAEAGNARLVGQGLAALVGVLLVWLAFRALRRVACFYRDVCELGQAERARLRAP